MIVTIHVTAEDIASGQPGEPCSCPVALAIMRELPGLFPWVDETCVAGSSASPIALAEDIPLPPAAVGFIFALDHEKAGDVRPDPFEFDIDVPDALLEAVTS